MAGCFCKYHGSKQDWAEKRHALPNRRSSRLCSRACSTYHPHQYTYRLSASPWCLCYISLVLVICSSRHISNSSLSSLPNILHHPTRFPTPNTHSTADGNDISLSIEETNKLRASLGLKPLKLDDDEAPEAGKQAPGTSTIDNDVLVSGTVPVRYTVYGLPQPRPTFHSPGCLAGWLAGCLAACLAACLPACLPGCLPAGLPEWRPACLL